MIMIVMDELGWMIALKFTRGTRMNRCYAESEMEEILYGGAYEQRVDVQQQQEVYR